MIVVPTVSVQQMRYCRHQLHRRSFQQGIARLSFIVITKTWHLNQSVIAIVVKSSVFIVRSSTKSPMQASDIACNHYSLLWFGVLQNCRHRNSRKTRQRGNNIIGYFHPSAALHHCIVFLAHCLYFFHRFLFFYHDLRYRNHFRLDQLYTALLENY
jgi:hypothetical protein